MMDQGYICDTAIRLMDVLETMLPVEHAERTARMERGRIRNNQKFELQTDYPPAAVLRVERGICASLPEVRKLLETSAEHAEQFVCLMKESAEGRKDLWWAIVEFLRPAEMNRWVERRYTLEDLSRAYPAPGEKRQLYAMPEDQSKRYAAILPLLKEALAGQTLGPEVPLELHACLRGWDAASASEQECCARLLGCLRMEVLTEASLRWHNRVEQENAEAMQLAQTRGRKIAEAGMNAGVGCLLFLPRLIPNLLAMLVGKVHHEHLDWSAPLRFSGPSGPVVHVYGDKEAKVYFSHLDALLAHADTLVKIVSADSSKAGTLAVALRRVAEGQADFAGAFVSVCGAWADAIVTRELATEFVRSDAMIAVVRRIFLPV